MRSVGGRGDDRDRRDGPERVGVLVERVLEARGLAADIERGSALGGWRAAVGPSIARVARPSGFDRTTLFVDVRSSAWLMELRMMERQLLDRLNRVRPEGGFERIIFRLAESAFPADRAE